MSHLDVPCPRIKDCQYGVFREECDFSFAIRRNLRGAASLVQFRCNERERFSRPMTNGLAVAEDAYLADNNLSPTVQRDARNYERHDLRQRRAANIFSPRK